MNIKRLFGILPNTDTYEKAKSALFSDYKRYLEIESSEELKNYLELKEEVESDEFAKAVSEIKAQKFNDTPEYKKEQELIALEKSAEIKTYNKFISSGKVTWIDEYEKSTAYQGILDLEKEIDSDEFKAVEKEMARPGTERFKDSEAYMKIEALQELEKDQQIVNYLKFKKEKNLSVFQKLHNSKEWEEYVELEKYINSKEFQDEKAAIDPNEYKNSELKEKEDAYNKLAKTNNIVTYKNLSALPECDDFLAVDGSEKLENYNQLLELTSGNEFKAERKKIEKSTFKNTPEFEKLQKLKKEKKSGGFKKYHKLLNSKEYKTYKEIEGSEKLEQLETLRAYVETEEFIQVKEYMLLKPAQKFEKSEEYQKEQAYKELSNSENIKWFLKVQKEQPFENIKNLELTFEDTFESDKLDTKKWMTRYFWGDALLNDSFSMFSDQHLNTDGKNVEINGGVLSIVTKKEQASGKAWNPGAGFMLKDFDYTSGLINTGGSFRQKYGIFEAKIKMTPSSPVCHAFWMIADQMLPHIDIVKYDQNIWMNNFWMYDDQKVADNKKKLGASKYTSKYFIFTLEWKKDLLVWKVNGETVSTQTTGVPDEPMYINFSSGIYNANKEAKNLPATLDVDWVRCYQFVDSE